MKLINGSKIGRWQKSMLLIANPTWGLLQTCPKKHREALLSKSVPIMCGALQQRLEQAAGHTSRLAEFRILGSTKYLLRTCCGVVWHGSPCWEVVQNLHAKRWNI